MREIKHVGPGIHRAADMLEAWSRYDDAGLFRLAHDTPRKEAGAVALAFLDLLHAMYVQVYGSDEAAREELGKEAVSARAQAAAVVATVIIASARAGQR